MALYKIIAKPSFVRVTSLAMWFDCQYNWAQKFIHGVESESSQAASIGTAVHAIIEKFLRDGCVRDNLTTPGMMKHWRIIPNAEVENLISYLEWLSNANFTPFEIEQQFNLLVFANQPGLRGHIDCLAVSKTDPETVYIIDHKTNRSYEGVDVWSKRLQQLCYAYAVRKLYPQFKRVYFIIGYVNLQTFVSWETDPEDDKLTEAKFSQFCLELEEACKSTYFARTINDKCNWCAERSTCPKLQSELVAFNQSVEERLIGIPDPERYELLSTVVTISSKMKEEIAGRLIDRVMAGEQVKTADGMSEYMVTYSKRRELSMESMIQVMVQFGLFPEQAVHYIETFDKLLSAKVAGLDSLKKSNPELYALLSSCITEKVGTNPLLKTTKLTSAPLELPPGEDF